LAALLYCREREITDTLVDLLIGTVHRIGARAEKKVKDTAMAEFKRVAGKESILFSITEASVGDPEGQVQEVVYPAAGGIDSLLDLQREYRAKGSTFRQHKQRVFKASYTHHYRAGLIAILDALEFHSTNPVHRPVLDALELIQRYRAETSNATRYYASGEHIPVTGVVPAELVELLYRTDKRGRSRVIRTVYECGVFQTLRDKLRCKSASENSSGSGEAADHGAGHREVEHGFLVVRSGLVVAYAAAMLADPPKCALHCPDPGTHVEPADPRQALDDLNRQGEHALAPAGQPPPVAGITPDELDGGERFPEVGQQPETGVTVLDRGGGDQYRKHDPVGIDCQVSLAPVGSLPTVPAPAGMGHGVRGGHGLRVDDRRRRAGISPVA
jgi:hypothetical protein